MTAKRKPKRGDKENDGGVRSTVSVSERTGKSETRMKGSIAVLSSSELGGDQKLPDT